MNSNIIGFRSLTRLFAVVLPLLLLAGPANGQKLADRDTMLTGAQWQAFNENIINALKSENEGAREGALKQIALYGDYMQFPELTVFSVMRMYRDGTNVPSRRLAIVALGNMNSKWAIEFLDMLSPYEDNESLRKTMDSVVRQYRKEHNEQSGM